MIQQHISKIIWLAHALVAAFTIAKLQNYLQTVKQTFGTATTNKELLSMPSCSLHSKD